MLDPYLGILFVGVLALLNGVGMIGVSHFIQSRRPTAAKAMPYESGIDPLGDTKERFSVGFYIVAMLFIVLDIETLFLIPWAVMFREFGLVGFIEMGIFLTVLFAGIIYAWRKGALEWD